MRTLQEKYNAIQEGKFSKDHFLAEARMQQPQLVTRFNGYDDAVQILKNKEMISDVKIEEARLTKNNLTDYRYKPTNEMDKYPYEQILRGLRVELETMGVQGTPTAEEYAKALAKVSKNLAKDSIFYTNQLAGVNPKVDQHDQMVTATAKNTVDTFNGMKKAELKEGFKKLIKKVLSEELTDVENYNKPDVYEMQGPKEDSYYKSELSDYLDDNGIFGFTDRIHNIMTGPDEGENVDELVRFLEDNQIYGYNRGIEAIYADYPYDQHWMNQPDEDEKDDIPHPRGYEEASDEESFDDLFEATDTEADKNMVRKLMTMYETEPSKFERVHKQAQVQASTTQDIKHKHLLSLIDRAKAGALQKATPEIPGFEGTRDALNNLFEESDEDKLQRYEQYTYTLNGETIVPDEIGFYNNYLGAELDGKFYKFSIPSEDGVVQLKSPQGKTGMYTENIFESVSLTDLI